MMPEAITTNNIHVVVNMMGPADKVDKVNNLWGAQSHYKQDRDSIEYKAQWDGSMTDDRVQAAQEYFDSGGHAFYETRGVHYVEEASADDSSTVVAQHFPKVNAQLFDILKGLRNESPSGQTHVLFHCYCGRNRSAAAMCAFWYLWKGSGSKGKGGTPMIDIIRDAIGQRPTILSRWGKNYTNFLLNLLIYEKGVLSAWAVSE